MPLIFDTETTGLIENRSTRLNLQPEIIEFYGIDGDDEIDTLIKPKIKELPEIITKITGLTDDDLKDQRPFRAHAPAIKNLIEKADCVVAHNLSFDMDMVDLEFERLEQTVAWPKERICTVEQTVYLKGYRLNLSALYELLFEEKFKDAHRAKYDVQALARCYGELKARDII